MQTVSDALPFRRFIKESGATFDKFVSMINETVEREYKGDFDRLAFFPLLAKGLNDFNDKAPTEWISVLQPTASSTEGSTTISFESMIQWLNTDEDLPPKPFFTVTVSARKDKHTLVIGLDGLNPQYKEVIEGVVEHYSELTSPFVALFGPFLRAAYNNQELIASACSEDNADRVYFEMILENMSVRLMVNHKAIAEDNVLVENHNQKVTASKVK